VPQSTIFVQNRISNGDGACPYDWVYERILQKAREETEEAAAAGSTVQWGFNVESTDVPTFSRKVQQALPMNARLSQFTL
jgi:hypothetical protein